MRIIQGNWGGRELKIGALGLGFCWVGGGDYTSKTRAVLASWHARRSHEWRWALYWTSYFVRPHVQWWAGMKTVSFAWFSFSYQPRTRRV